MSMTDLNATNEIVIPPKEAVTYPLKYATRILLEGTPQTMRAYVILTPYRRIYGDVQVQVGTNEETGEPIMETRSNQLVGEELMPSNAEGFQNIELDVPNIMPAPSAEGKALVEQFLGQYMQAGGDLTALVMAGMVIAINQIGIAQGKLAPE